MPTLYTAINASRMTQGAQQGSSAVRTLVNAVQGARAPMTSFNVGLASIGTSAVVTQRALTSLTGSFAIAASVRNLISEYTAFNREITTLGAVLNITGADLKVFSDYSREVGRTTQYSAIQAAQALVQLSRAGFTQKEALDTLKPTLDLAIAGNLGLEQATNIASVTLRQFKIPAQDAARVMDILTTAANQSNTDIQGLAEALKFAGPVAASAGISLEETAAAIGVLSNAGLKGSLAGTALRGMITSLLAPTPQAVKVLNELGVSASELDFKTHGLVGVLQRLERANVDASNAAEIFTRRQSSGAIAILNAMGNLRELSQQVTKSGEASRTAAMQSESLQVSFDKLRNAVTEVYIATGEGGLGASLKLLTQRATEAILALNGTHKGLENMSTGARVLIALFQTLIISVTIFVGLKLAVWAYTSAVAVWQLVTATRALSAAMATNPIGLIAVGLSVLISTLIGFDALVPKITDGMDTMSDAARKAKQEVERLASSLQSIGNLNPRWARAVGTNDLDEQIGIMTERIAGLKKLRDDLLVTPNNVSGGSLREAFGGNMVPPTMREEMMRQIKQDQQTIQFYRDLVASRPGKTENDYINLGNAEDPFNLEGANPKDLTSVSNLIQQLQKDTKTWSEYNVSAKAAVKAIDYALGHYNTQLTELQKRLANSKTPLEIENQKKFSDILQKARSDIEFEAKLVGKSADERAVLTEKRRLETEAQKLGVRQSQIGIAMLISELANGKALARAKEEEAAAEKRRTEQRAQAQQSIADLTEQVRLLGIASDRERAIEEAVYRARQQASALPTTELEVYLTQVRELTGAVWDLQDAEKKRNEEKRKAEQIEENRKQAIQAINDQITALRIEAETYGMTAEQRQRYLAVQQAEIMLRRAGVESTEELTKALDKQMEALQEYQKWQNMADQTGDDFVDSLIDISLKGKDAAEAVRDLAMAFEEMFLKEIVLAGLKGAVSSSFLSIFQNMGLAPTAQAMGGVWQSGRLQPFASGGVVSSPTLFPMANGTGLMGEAGPEAIMPLGRNARGELGVKGNGGEGKTVVVNMKVITNDADSFRRNRRAVMSDVQKGLR